MQIATDHCGDIEIRVQGSKSVTQQHRIVDLDPLLAARSSTRSRVYTAAHASFTAVASLIYTETHFKLARLYTTGHL